MMTFAQERNLNLPDFFSQTFFTVTYILVFLVIEITLKGFLEGFLVRLTIKIRQSSIYDTLGCYLGPWYEQLIEQASDVPSIIFFS